MKKIAIFILLLSMIGMLAGCSCFHDWKLATCTDPITCLLCGKTRGLPLEHIWKQASCTQPKRCMRCDKTDESALGHQWVDATCTTPKTCSACQATDGEAIGHNWLMASDNTPRTCTICHDMEPLALPENGEVLLGQYLYRDSELTINSSTSEACYIKLKNSNGADVFAFFVRAGSKTTIAVPSGHYYVYFAYGTDWYGTEYIFGENTTYAKDDELLDFTSYTWSYTLYPSIGGNFSETPISADEF